MTYTCYAGKEGRKCTIKTGRRNHHADMADVVALSGFMRHRSAGWYVYLDQASTSSLACFRQCFCKPAAADGDTADKADGDAAADKADGDDGARGADGDLPVEEWEPRHVVQSGAIRRDQFIAYWADNLPDVTDRPDIPPRKIQFWMMDDVMPSRKKKRRYPAAHSRMKGMRGKAFNQAVDYAIASNKWYVYVQFV